MDVFFIFRTPGAIPVKTNGDPTWGRDPLVGKRRVRLNRILRLAYVVKPVIIYQEQITTVSFAATVDDERDNITFTTYNALRKANARDDEATTSDIPHYEDETEIKTKRMRAIQTQTSIRRPKKIRKQATDSEITKETTKTDNKPKTMATMTMTNEDESDNE